MLFSYDYSVEKDVGSTDEDEVALCNVENRWATTLNWKRLVLDRRDGPSKKYINYVVNLIEGKDAPSWVLTFKKICFSLHFINFAFQLVPCIDIK